MRKSIDIIRCLQVLKLTCKEKFSAKKICLTVLFSSFCINPLKGQNIESKLNSKVIDSFLSKNCYDCHDDDLEEGGVNLMSLPRGLAEGKYYKLWVKVYDQISNGEMPPKKKRAPKAEDKNKFLGILKHAIKSFDDEIFKVSGRASLRRLNRFEYENSLRDLLGAPWLQISQMLPEDSLSDHFNKSGNTLQISHVQMTSYFNAANYALKQVVATQKEKPQEEVRKYYSREQRSFSYFEDTPRGIFPVLGHSAAADILKKGRAHKKVRNFKNAMTVGSSNPEKRELEAMAMVKSNYEPGEPKYNSFTAQRSGFYKLRFKTWTIWVHPKEGQEWWRPDQDNISKGRTLEPVTIYSEKPPRQMRRLGSFNSFPDPNIQTIETYLLKGETIRVDASRFMRPRGLLKSLINPLATKAGQPGVAFAWLEVQGPIIDEWPQQGHKLLFGDLALINKADTCEVVSKNPLKDAESLIRRFLSKVFRSAYTDKQLKRYLDIFSSASDRGNSFKDALILSYTAILCSPEFIFLREQAGELSNVALANRLSLFLQNSLPDQQLKLLSKNGRLGNLNTLSSEVDRLLAKKESSRFINSFLDHWLDLRNLRNNSPDENLYPEYYLDDWLSESALDETREFFTALIKEDLPVSNLIDSGFIIINGRLAELYNIPGVEGAGFRRVKLSNESIRGGLLTQASILKVTADGTNTSPIMRGAWILERLLGQTPPSPPPNIPGIEVDTRGATNIRELLDKHRDSMACNSCHRKIDPPGFALESFDVFGAWRENYRKLSGEGDEEKNAFFKIGKSGQEYKLLSAQKVDSSGEMQSKGEFQNIKEFKKLLLQDHRSIARNLVKQFITYSTGVAPKFADREIIEIILDKAEHSQFGVRTLIKELVKSEIFKNK